MSWQRKSLERLALAVPVGVFGGLAVGGWWAISPLPSELTGLLSIVVVMPFVGVIRWFVRDQRRRAAFSTAGR